MSRSRKAALRWGGTLATAALLAAGLTGPAQAAAPGQTTGPAGVVPVLQDRKSVV